MFSTFEHQRWFRWENILSITDRCPLGRAFMINVDLLHIKYEQVRVKNTKIIRKTLKDYSKSEWIYLQKGFIPSAL
jgi:hypothetical protein